MFILVFRPHQRKAWAKSFNCESDFVDGFLRDYYARSCNADADGETLDAMEGKSQSERYAIAFERVAHDLNCLTRLDDAAEVSRYVDERDYSGHHNKAIDSVEQIAREIGWLERPAEEEEENDE